MCKMWTGMCVCVSCVYYVRILYEGDMRMRLVRVSIVCWIHTGTRIYYIYAYTKTTYGERVERAFWLYRTDSQTHTNKQHYRDCLRRRRAFKRKIGDASVHATLLARQQFRVNCSRSRLVHKTRDKTQAALLRSTNTDGAQHTNAPHMQTPLHARARARAHHAFTRATQSAYKHPPVHIHVYTHTQTPTHTHTHVKHTQKPRPAPIIWTC